ncbi:MAG TPA: M20/M25/M40 family metallo-hydrolase [Gammaproteobacteria bacterium]|nr:M20/M25/M40 family metallo-hydrolase [Gammaproteobacteria bacterium]
MSSQLDTILELLDETHLIALLTDAVEQYSPSYAEEPAMQVFAERLTACGVRYIRQPLPPGSGPATDTRANLIIELGPRPSALMWVGHVDTVPLIDEEEQRLHRDGDILHGLGTADMKSGCAAIVEAVIAVVRSGVELGRGLTVALVVGEEEYGDGSEALLDWRSAPLTVIGEPTGLIPCVDHYGYYECRMTVKGTRAHAALPEMGASAIHAMLAWMQLILESGAETTHGLTISPRQINGGAGLFMVAQECEAAIDIHAPPGVDDSVIDMLIEQARDAAQATHPRCQLQFEKLYWANGYTNPADDPLLATVQRAFRETGLEWSPTAFRSHSDGSLFHQKGSIPLICGPGRLEVAHTRHEHVSLRETCDAARLYVAIIHAVCIA